MLPSLSGDLAVPTLRGAKDETHARARLEAFMAKPYIPIINTRKQGGGNAKHQGSAESSFVKCREVEEAYRAGFFTIVQCTTFLENSAL